MGTFYTVMTEIRDAEGVWHNVCMRPTGRDVRTADTVGGEGSAFADAFDELETMSTARLASGYGSELFGLSEEERSEKKKKNAEKDTAAGFDPFTAERAAGELMTFSVPYDAVLQFIGGRKYDFSGFVKKTEKEAADCGAAEEGEYSEILSGSEYAKLPGEAKALYEAHSWCDPYGALYWMRRISEHVYWQIQEYADMYPEYSTPDTGDVRILVSQS